MRFYFYFCSLLILWLAGCSFDEDTKFTDLPPSQTNITFSNDVENTIDFNIQNYLYFYDGGGVAVGDINNNGLPDLFFVGNEVQNRLYLNKGNFEFEDITESAGIINDPESWSTGVTMADVNGNGYLDIYVSRVNYLTKSGPNQLFINNGDNTFTERAAEYGIDFEGYSTQAAFFDYNNNGRLDLFILNHAFHGDDTYGEAEELRQIYAPKAGDKLFRNDGDSFTDVTREAGIISSPLGYGLGVAITDINFNGLPDIYVGNDFHEDDYLYINNGDGTFTESVYDYFSHTSSSSMGNDIADLTNNGLPDLISLDMMPEDHETFMRSGGPDLVPIAEAKKNFGFGEKTKRNVHQVNRGFGPDGKPVFKEIAFASGVAKTDWSWAALIADFDNDGFQDLFVSNGMPLRPNDLDYVAALQQVRQRYQDEELDQREYELLERMPDVIVPNYIFKNNGDLTFTDKTESWGFSKPTSSTGAVYADLNNNGFLDLVVNNINERAQVHRNNAEHSENTHYLHVKLNGVNGNTTGIGAKVFLYKDEQKFYREHNPTRGFQSSVNHILHVGLGQINEVDSLKVIWPGGAYQVIKDVASNQMVELNQEDASGNFDYTRKRTSFNNTVFQEMTENVQFDHSHVENDFSDFNREPLMPYKLSRMGPGVAVGDVTGNGLDDIYFGGAKGHEGKLFIQESSGQFRDSGQTVFAGDRNSEDVDALFFDATGDGKLDLYVVSAGNERSESVELFDRLYINTGDGIFGKSENSLPDIMVNGSMVIAADFNGNGHNDLFVGGHISPWRYGIGPQSVLYENNGNGIFRDITEDVAPELETVGNVTAAEWIYRPDKELPDLLVVGEWMNVHYFENNGGEFVKKTDEYGLSGLNGLWQSIHVTDLTGNGFDDIVLGNFGMNSRMQASAESPIKLYVNDFDDDGQTEPLIAYTVDGKEKPFEQLDELLAQIRTVTQSIRSYREFAGKDIYELFGSEKIDEALQKEVRELRSMVLLSDDEGGFTAKELPFEAQLFPVKAIYTDDFTGDGNKDIILAGNKHYVKPSIGGMMDAGRGLLLSGDGNGNFTPKNITESGLYVKGETRKILPVQIGEENYLIFVRNNDKPLFYQLR